MDKLVKLGLGLSVLAILVGGAAFFKSPTVVTNTETVVKEVGGGGFEPFHKFFGEGVTIGGKKVATTTGETLTTYTVTANELTNTSLLAINPSVNLTLKFSATSTFSVIPNIGDRFRFVLRNASSTAAATITLAAQDASVDFQENEGGNLVLAGLDSGTIEVVRNALSGDDQVVLLWHEYQKE